jgi:hypothetical protein
MDSLTFSGNEITDALRALGVQGDGATTPAGVGIWPAATNECINGGFETNSTGWAGSGTPVRSTAWYKFGTTSWLIDYTPTNNDASAFGPIKTCSAGDIKVVSAYVNVLDNASQGQRCFIQWFSGADGSGQIGDTSGTYFYSTSPNSAPSTGTFTGTGEVRVWSYGTAPVGTQSYRIRVVNGTTGTQRMRYYVDGVQYETGTTPTPYIHTDGATATRGNGSVYGDKDLVDGNEGFFACRVVPGFSQGFAPESRSHFFFRSNAAHYIHGFYQDASSAVFMERPDDGGSNHFVSQAWTPTAGVAATLVWTWSKTSISVARDSSNFTTTTVTSNNTSLQGSDNFYLGSSPGSGFGMRMLWAIGGKTTITDTERKWLVALPDQLDTSEHSSPIQASFVWPGIDTTYYPTTVPEPTLGGQFVVRPWGTPA